MSTDRFESLMQTFPTVADRKAITVADLEAMHKRSTSSGARWAAAFLLHVWHGSSVSFDLCAAWGAWDAEHRAAWKAWAADPWWA